MKSNDFQLQMEDSISASEKDQSPPLLHTLVKFHTRFCSDSSSATMVPHVSSSIPDQHPQPMDLDDHDPNPSHSILPDPITILQTLVSNPTSFPEDENHQTLVIRDAFLPGRGEIRTGDVGNPSSFEPDGVIDMASIFRVWDLNTESPELENGTLTEILTALVAKTENCWFDEGLGFLSQNPTTDVFDLREMRSVLEAQMMERPPPAVEGGLEISVSALVRLLRSIL